MQAFRATDDGVIALEPRQYPTASQAERVARILAEDHAGVVAWSRAADPDVGEYGEPTELVRLGKVPDWFDEGGGVE